MHRLAVDIRHALTNLNKHGAEAALPHVTKDPLGSQRKFDLVARGVSNVDFWKQCGHGELGQQIMLSASATAMDWCKGSKPRPDSTQPNGRDGGPGSVELAECRGHGQNSKDQYCISNQYWIQEQLPCLVTPSRKGKVGKGQHFAQLLVGSLSWDRAEHNLRNRVSAGAVGTAVGES